MVSGEIVSCRAAQVTPQGANIEDESLRSHPLYR